VNLLGKEGGPSGHSGKKGKTTFEDDWISSSEKKKEIRIFITSNGREK